MLIKANVKAAIRFILVEILGFFIFVCLNYSSFYLFYEGPPLGGSFYILRLFKANYSLLSPVVLRKLSGIVI